MRLAAFLLAIVVTAFGAMVVSAGAAERTLAERLGYQATDRLLIVNGDDAGMCHAANRGTIECLESGLMTSATIMVPCPWFFEIAEYARTHAAADFGVHLCHTAEWKHYRWGPVAPRGQVAGLIDPQGCLWPSIRDVYGHATPEEALIEGRAQIRKALDAGIDITHLDSHMGTLQYDLGFFDVYRQLALEFRLPLRMASQSTLEQYGQGELRAKLAEQGIVFPDHFVHEELEDQGADVKGFWLGVVRGLKPGVTELYVHAAKPTEELRAITGSWRTRAAECETFSQDEDMRRLIEDEGIVLIGYRPLRELQRRAR